MLRGGERCEMARWRDGVRGMGEHCLGESPIVSCAGGAQVALTPREGAQHHSWRRPSSGGEEVPVRNDGSDRTNTYYEADDHSQHSPVEVRENELCCLMGSSHPNLKASLLRSGGPLDRGYR